MNAIFNTYYLHNSFSFLRERERERERERFLYINSGIQSVTTGAYSTYTRLLLRGKKWSGALFY